MASDSGPAENQWYSICLPQGPCLTCAAGVVDLSQDIPVGTEYHGAVSFKDFGKDPSGSLGTQYWQLFPIDAEHGTYAIRPQAYETKLSLHYTSSNGIEVSNKDDDSYLWDVSVEGNGLAVINPNDNTEYALSVNGEEAALTSQNQPDINQRSFVLQPLGNIEDDAFSSVDPSIASQLPNQQPPSQSPSEAPPQPSSPAPSQAPTPTPEAQLDSSIPTNGIPTGSQNIDITAVILPPQSQPTPTQLSSGFSTSTKTSSKTFSTPSHPTKNTSLSPSPTSSSTGSSNHIGAALGGAIGGVAGILLLVLAIIIFKKRERVRRAAMSHPQPYKNRPRVGPIAELDAVDTALPHRELGDTGLVEVCGESKPTELPTRFSWYRHEKKG